MQKIKSDPSAANVHEKRWSLCSVVVTRDLLWLPAVTVDDRWTDGSIITDFWGYILVLRMWMMGALIEKEKNYMLFQRNY